MIGCAVLICFSLLFAGIAGFMVSFIEVIDNLNL